jgi:hypothetical protein
MSKDFERVVVFLDEVFGNYFYIETVEAFMM